MICGLILVLSSFSARPKLYNLDIYIYIYAGITEKVKMCSLHTAKKNKFLKQGEGRYLNYLL
jgi:hypothetical protein